MIIPEKTNQPIHRDIRLTNRGAGEFQCISQNHSFYMSLHYTLLFPYGEPRWHWGIKLQPVIEILEGLHIDSDENNHDEANRRGVHQGRGHCDRISRDCGNQSHDIHSGSNRGQRGQWGSRGGRGHGGITHDGLNN